MNTKPDVKIWVSYKVSDISLSYDKVYPNSEFKVPQISIEPYWTKYEEVNKTFITEDMILDLIHFGGTIQIKDYNYVFDSKSMRYKDDGSVSKRIFLKASPIKNDIINKKAKHKNIEDTVLEINRQIGFLGREVDMYRKLDTYAINKCMRLEEENSELEAQNRRLSIKSWAIPSVILLVIIFQKLITL